MHLVGGVGDRLVEFRSLEAEDADVGTQPQAPCLVFDDCRDRRGRQPAGAPHRLEQAVGVAREPAVRAQPERPVVAFVDGAIGSAGQAAAHFLERPVGPDHVEAAFREGEPGAAGAIRVHGHDLAARGRHGRHAGQGHDAVPPAQQPLLDVVEPEAAMTIGCDDGDLVRPRAPESHRRQMIGLEAQQIPTRRQPQRAALVAMHRRQRRLEGNRRPAAARVVWRESDQLMQRADPHAPVGRGLDAAHETQIDDGRDPMRRQAVDAVEGAGPDVPFAILEERLQAFAEQPRLAGRPLDGGQARVVAEAHAPQALAPRANPHVALRVAQQAGTAAVFECVRRHRPAADEAEARFRIGDPEPAGIVPGDGADVLGDGLDASEPIGPAVEDEDAGLGSDRDRALRIGVCAIDRLVGQAGVPLPPAAVAEHIEAGVPGHPDATRRVLDDAGDGTGHRAVAAVIQHFPATDAAHAAGIAETDPQGAVARHGQGAHRALRQRRRARRRRPADEGQAVEADQTLVGAQPQVPVGVLRDGPHGARGQAVLEAP